MNFGVNKAYIEKDVRRQEITNFSFTENQNKYTYILVNKVI
jgi:hypothetical protein